MNEHVEHYIHLREQGMGHDRAVAHTMQRFGILRPALLDDLATAYRNALRRVMYLDAAGDEAFDKDEA